MNDDVGARAVRLMERLHAGLNERGVPHDGPDYDDAVTRALREIDRIAELRAQGASLAAQGAALAEYGADLEAVFDGGLTAEQEIRARALPVAAELVSVIYPFDNRDDLLDWVSDATMRLAALIRDGGGIPRVSAEERSDDTKAPSKITEVG